MRRCARKITILLLVGFGLLIFSPLLLCGGSSFTKSEASDCCRAMDYKCNNSKSNGPCCKHESVAPLHLAIHSPSELSPPQPLATVGVLSITGNELFGNQSGHHLLILLPGHSPPESVALFLFHSTLLI